MSEDRLQKILARAGVASRRKAEELIREGRVTVNGLAADLGGKADPARDVVKLDGRRVQPPSVHRYLLLNKPRAVMSTVDDPGGRPTVLDLVPQALRKALFPVGRLDFDTEGLLILTDDGDFAQQVAHPRHGCRKTYEVKVKGRPGEELLDRLRSGIVLDGRRTAPCLIRPRRVKTPIARRRARGLESGESDNSWWVVELGEGRTRQIREMFLRIGHPVQKLRRVAIGPLSDATLPLGAIRELSEQEVEKLRRAAKAAATPAGRAAAAARSEEAATRARRHPETRPVGKRPALSATRSSPFSAAAPGASAAASAQAAGRAASRRVREAGRAEARPARRSAAKPAGGRTAKPAARSTAKPAARKPAGRAAGAKPAARSGARKPAARAAGGKPGSRTAAGKPAARPASRQPAAGTRSGGSGKPRTGGPGKPRAGGPGKPRSGGAGKPRSRG